MVISCWIRQFGAKPTPVTLVVSHEKLLLLNKRWPFNIRCSWLTIYSKSTLRYFDTVSVFLQPKHIPWRFIQLCILFLIHISRGFMGKQRESLTIAGSSLNLAHSCPFQFTHLQNGNNNKHLRESIHMSSLRPWTLGSPGAQQRDIASNSDALNGLLMEPASLCWQ